MKKWRNRNSQKQNPRNSISTLAQASSQRNYANEPLITMKLNANPFLLVSAGGFLATNRSIDPSVISGWTSRYINTFSEVRVLACTVKIRPVTNADGVSRFWFQEENVAPTYQSALAKSQRLSSNSNGNAASSFQMTWRATSQEDLVFTLVSSGATRTSAYFCIYTDSTNMGSPAASNLFYMDMEYTVQFRGLRY